MRLTPARKDHHASHSVPALVSPIDSVAGDSPLPSLRRGKSAIYTERRIQQVCVMSALLTGLFGDYVRRSLSMPNESNKIDRQKRVELTPDFLGESHHEFVAKLAYQHWEGRGMPLVRLRLTGSQRNELCTRRW
jgi:hypothetical protein